MILPLLSDKTEAPILLEAEKIIVNMCLQNVLNQTEFSEGLTPLTKILQSPNTSPKVKRFAIMAIGSIVAENRKRQSLFVDGINKMYFKTGKILSSIRKFGVIEQLIALLNSEDLLVQRAAVGCLRILSQLCIIYKYFIEWGY